jgi:predicted nuclease with RNAse H fold
VDAFAGLDVAVARGKRLPISVCVRADGALVPFPLRSRSQLPPRLPGNVGILDAYTRRELALEVLAYLREIERSLGVTIRRIAIDAPRLPRPSDFALRACEGALRTAGISFIQTPTQEIFDRIPRDVAAYRADPSSRRGLPHANRIWMLFGFQLFETLSSGGWSCIEVYPQAIVRGLGVGATHKKRRGGVLEQLTAAARWTGWPSRPAIASLADIAFGAPDDRLDAYLAAWVASLAPEDCEVFGRVPDDAIWRPKALPPDSLERCDLQAGSLGPRLAARRSAKNVAPGNGWAVAAAAF